MSEWISVQERLPDVSKPCLLFIKQFRTDGGSFWDSYAIKGFWSDEQEDDESGFYADNFSIIHLGCKHNHLDGTSVYEFISDCEYIKITHWMPLPEPPK